MSLKVRPRRSQAHIQRAESPFKHASGGDVLTALGTAHREFAQRMLPSLYASFWCSLNLRSLAAHPYPSYPRAVAQTRVPCRLSAPLLTSA